MWMFRYTISRAAATKGKDRRERLGHRPSDVLAVSSGINAIPHQHATVLLLLSTSAGESVSAAHRERDEGFARSRNGELFVTPPNQLDSLRPVGRCQGRRFGLARRCEWRSSPTSGFARLKIVSRVVERPPPRSFCLRIRIAIVKERSREAKVRRRPHGRTLESTVYVDDLQGPEPQARDCSLHRARRTKSDEFCIERNAETVMRHAFRGQRQRPCLQRSTFPADLEPERRVRNRSGRVGSRDREL